MEALRRNKRTFWYRLHNESLTPISRTDEWGNVVETGEYVTGYAAPVEMRANISTATGNTNRTQFGNLEQYDKVIVTANTSCPITESTVLYIDTAPVYNEETGEWSAHDYVVVRVAKSLNSVSIAVRKVDVS